MRRPIIGLGGRTRRRIQFNITNTADYKTKRRVGCSGYEGAGGDFLAVCAWMLNA